MPSLNPLQTTNVVIEALSAAAMTYIGYDLYRKNGWRRLHFLLIVSSVVAISDIFFAFYPTAIYYRQVNGLLQQVRALSLLLFEYSVLKALHSLTRMKPIGYWAVQVYIYLCVLIPSTSLIINIAYIALKQPLPAWEADFIYQSLYIKTSMILVYQAWQPAYIIYILERHIKEKSEFEKNGAKIKHESRILVRQTWALLLLDVITSIIIILGGTQKVAELIHFGLAITHLHVILQSFILKQVIRVTLSETSGGSGSQSQGTKKALAATKSSATQNQLSTGDAISNHAEL